VIHFCFDDLGPNPDLGYPNLAQHNLASDQFDTTWPRSIPLRLMMYFQYAGIPFKSWLVGACPRGSWYPVALSWHDHSIDYFSLMSPQILQALRRKHIKVLFYYHEGDNPAVIKHLMDQHTQINRLPPDCYHFISANSRADQIANFRYFSDHEHFFQYINRRQKAPELDLSLRSKQFVALNRTHKWWRASIMADLWHRDLLKNSLWSYNTECTIDDAMDHNPLMVYEYRSWPEQINRFIANGPYWCDSADPDNHNDHRWVNVDLYRSCYCHLIIETHFDADGSQGAFITEKTYKCLKYAQPFIVIGTPGTLELLRQNGYRVFDHVLDNRYDRIQDNTQRWLSIRGLIEQLAKQDLHSWFSRCMEDLQHNQSQFQSHDKKDLRDLAAYLDTV
jgi:hypothetical protein